MWSPAITIEAPTVLAVSRDQAKEFLRLDADDTGFDNEVDAWIAGVAGEAEAITGTRLISQKVSLQTTSFGDLERLPIGPVTSVEAITYFDPSNEQQTIPASDYALIGAGLSVGIRSTAGPWPAKAGGSSMVTVTVKAGYGPDPDAVPPGVRIALLKAIRANFDDKPIELAPLLGNYRIWL